MTTETMQGLCGH